MSNDPWKHRAKNMTCSTCMFFVLKERADGKPSKLGRCRNHSPTMRGYPAVFENDWCGEHKLDEDKT